MMPAHARAARFIILLGCLASVSATGCSRFDILNGLISSRGYHRTPDLSYGVHSRQKLDVYRPRGDAPSTGTSTGTPPSRGVVVFFYGGSWDSGSKDDYRFVAEALTSRGFVAVVPDYRLYPAVTFPAFVEDGAQAVRWVHDNAARIGADPRCIYLMGHSAGAHIAALLTLDAHYLQDVGLNRGAIRATASLSGVYDFVPGTDTRPIFGMRRGDPTPPEIQPMHFADCGGAPPMLLIHGKQDDVTDPANALRLAARIRAAGGEVRTILYDQRGHAGVAMALAKPFRCLAPVLCDVATFFKAH